MLLAVGIALIGIGIALWLLAGTMDLRTLAAANLATAVLGVVWCLVANDFSTAGNALTAATAAALALLAAAQLLGSRS